MTENQYLKSNNEEEVKEAIRKAEEDREMLGQYYQFIPSIN